MTEPLDPHGQIPAENLPPIYALRTHAEMSWQDLTAFILGCFSPLSVLAVIFGLIGGEEAKKVGLKQHPLGVVGLIFGWIGTGLWAAFWVFWILVFLVGSTRR